MRRPLVWLLAIVLSGCTVGPDYVRPTAPTPAVYKELQGWTQARPSDDIDRGQWWRIYGDPLLDRLESEVDIGNQNLRAFEAAYRQARAIVREAEANYFPTIAAGVSGSRAGSGVGKPTTIKTAEVSASWDLDLWGRVRRLVESDKANAQATAAELASARLSAQSDLATFYFQLRFQDSLGKLLSDTVHEDQRSLEIVRNQYKAGTAPRSDVITAETLVKTTQASLIAVELLRAQFEHAIALLIGKPPADLSIPVGALSSTVPDVPVQVPSVLLQRRPDIAQAERTVQAQNALIGVATAALYPDVSLSAVFGFAGSGALFGASNEIWSLAASGTQVLFDGGLRHAVIDAAQASYEQAVANYRQTVLAAFSDVENQLSGQRILADQSRAEADAVALARQAVQIALNEYRAGTVTYTTVVTAQATLLSEEETALQTMESRLTMNVSLVRALGGGWTDDLLTHVDDDGNPIAAAAAPKRPVH
jgi:NodT family efflux transporter outer membrane factor (OMF) lipoprotein